MSITTLIQTAESLLIDVEIYADGQLVSGVLAVDVALGLSQRNGQAQLHVLERPSWASEKAQIAIWAGYAGERRQIFRGELSGLSWEGELESGKQTVALDCRDPLFVMDKEWGGADQIFTTGQTDAAIVVALLEARGITDHSIESSGWEPVQVEDITLTKGDSPWSLIERLDFFSGYKTFAGPDGRIYRRRISGAPAPSASWTAQEHVDLLSIQRRRDIASSEIYNGARFAGLTWEGVAFVGEAGPVSNPDLDSDAVREEQDDLLQSDSDAANAAQTFVADHNRKNEGLELSVIGNPLLWPGMTVQAVSSQIEQASVLALVDSVRHSIDLETPRWTTSLTTTGGNLSGYNASAPQVTIALQLIAEAEDDGSGITKTLLIVADGGGSFSPAYPEDQLTYAWTLAATGGTPTPASGSGSVLRATVDDSVTDVTATLTVTDPDGLATTRSTTGANTDTARLRQDLYLAVATLAEASSTGERTWVDQTVPGGAQTHALSDVAGPDLEAWGATNGHVYGSFDRLATALVDCGQPFGASDEITAVSIHGLDDTRLWAADATGRVAFGQVDYDAQTVSWTVMTAIPEGPVVEIREGYSFGSLRATAGQGYYRSEDGANAWTASDSGDTARRMTAGWGLNFYSFLNDSVPLRTEEGVTISWPALTPPVTHVRALTVGWRVAELYAADDQARLFTGTISGTAPITMTLTTTAPSGVNHMIRSGGIDGKIYVACDDGLNVWIPASTYLARAHATSSPVSMVGYGALHGPVLTVQASAIQAAKGGALLYTPSAGWALKSLPGGALASSVFSRAVADPSDPTQSRWMLYIASNLTRDGSGNLVVSGTPYSPVWETPDRGLTWTPLQMDVHDYGGSFSFMALAALYDTLGVRHVVAITAGTMDHWLGASGGGATLTHAIDQLVIGNLRAVEAGAGGELLVALDSGIHYIPAAGTSIASSPTSGLTSNHGIDGMPGPDGLMRGSVGLNWDNATNAYDLYASSDYRTVPERARLSLTLTSPGDLSASANAVWGTGGGTLRRFADLLGTPVITTVNPGGTVSSVRVGRRLRTAIGVIGANATVIYFSADEGVTWSTLPANGAAAGDLGGIDVLEEDTTP